MKRRNSGVAILTCAGLMSLTIAVSTCVIVVDATPASAASQIVIRGGVSCMSHAVSGVWVTSTGGTSANHGAGFATWAKASPAGYRAGYHITLTVPSVPINVQLHVGCGLIPHTTQWLSTSLTPWKSVGSGTSYLDTKCNEGSASQPRCPTFQAAALEIVSAAAAMHGYHYCWASGTKTGPNHEATNAKEAPDCTSSKTIGFDCIGLVIYSVFHATDIPITGLHEVKTALEYGTPVSLADLSVGDLMILGPDDAHIAIYAGNNMVWDANTALKGPVSSDGVFERPLSEEYPEIDAIRRIVPS
jgi:cell wall-associated NlpC family hydrolase